MSEPDDDQMEEFLADLFAGYAAEHPDLSGDDLKRQFDEDLGAMVRCLREQEPEADSAGTDDATHT